MGIFKKIKRRGAIIRTQRGDVELWSDNKEDSMADIVGNAVAIARELNNPQSPRPTPDYTQ